MMAAGPSIRQRTEEQEIASLSPHAVKSRFSRGRQRPEAPCDIRTDFQRDRDRIIHSKSFRRLKHKTQVFIAPGGDHFVTRLTHTLEVTQIARTIARALKLNEDLTEAIGLGHDLGHTPFGHMGEEVLNQLFPEGFRHNQQSLRVVEKLENSSRGLNLTWEVRDGIANHSKSMEEVLGSGWQATGTLEGDVVKISDLVAYVNHDIEDAIRAGLITDSDLPGRARLVLGSSHRQRINSMVTDIIRASWAASGETTGQEPVIGMSQPVRQAADELKVFLFERVYNVQSGLKLTSDARGVVGNLYVYFCAHPDELPADYRNTEEPAARRVVDYIAGMTDQYATRLAEKIGS